MGYTVKTLTVYGLWTLLCVPIFSVWSSEVFLEVGQNVTFTCLLPHLVQHEVWRYYVSDSDIMADIIATQEKVTSNYQAKDRFDIILTESVSYKLTIRDLHITDTGVYRCSEMSNRLTEYKLYVYPHEYPLCSSEPMDQNMVRF